MATLEGGTSQKKNRPVPEAVVTVLCIPVAFPRWREVASQKKRPGPEAVVTVLCTPDDGCG